MRNTYLRPTPEAGPLYDGADQGYDQFPDEPLYGNEAKAWGRLSVGPEYVRIYCRKSSFEYPLPSGSPAWIHYRHFYIVVEEETQVDHHVVDIKWTKGDPDDPALEWNPLDERITTRQIRASIQDRLGLF